MEKGPLALQLLERLFGLRLLGLPFILAGVWRQSWGCSMGEG
jgi:hypothetical protein